MINILLIAFKFQNYIIVSQNFVREYITAADCNENEEKVEEYAQSIVSNKTDLRILKGV